MKNKMICFTTLLLNLFGAQNIYAAESLSTKIHNQYQSLRAMGMGNAFTTVADDYSAMMYNPATLAKKKSGEIQFTLAGAGLSAKTATLMKDISDAEKNAVDENTRATAISAVLDQYYGKPLGVRAQALEFFWARPNWGIALLPLDLSLDMSVNRQLGPALDLNIKKDTTLAYGYGKEIMPNISGGILGKIIHRDSVGQSVSALELASNSNVLSKERFKEGITADVEIGFLWTPEFSKNEIAPAAKAISTDETLRAPQSEVTAAVPAASTESGDKTAAVSATATSADATKTEVVVAKSEKYTPLSVSVVLRNLISANFSKSTMVNKDATEAPSKIPRVIDIGAGYEFANLGSLKFLATAEAKNLLHPETTFKKSSHAGIEMDYSPGSWFQAQVRAGVNQMYFTAGLTLLLGVIEIDAVTYGEEVGTASTNVENRVGAVKVGFNF